MALIDELRRQNSNSFGDAAAASQNSSVAQVPQSPPRSLAAAAGLSATGVAAPALAPSAPTSPAVSREGNSYSGMSVSGNISVNGAAPGGTVSSAPLGPLARAAKTMPVPASPAVPAPGVPGAGQPLVSAAGLGSAGEANPNPGLATFAAAPQPANAPSAMSIIEAAGIRHSGNDWASRNNLRSAEVSANSITNNGGRWDSSGPGGSLAQQVYKAAVGNDLALQQSRPSLVQAAMQQDAETARTASADAGNTLRTGLEQQGGLARQALAGRDALAQTQIQADATLGAAQARAQGDRGAPAGYRWASGGTLESIPGGPADPNVRGNRAPLNDTQSKALQFGARMQESGATLERMAGEGVTQPGLIKRAADAIGMGAAANWTQSDAQQRVEQSQRDFINSVLRRESGAAIADSEFANARQQYFPQPGDAPDVIAQKSRNREIATRGILAEVPDAEKRVSQVLGDAPRSVAPASVSAPAAAQSPLPQGMSRQVGTSGGKPVYEDGSGNRFLGG